MSDNIFFLGSKGAYCRIRRNKCSEKSVPTKVCPVRFPDNQHLDMRDWTVYMYVCIQNKVFQITGVRICGIISCIDNYTCYVYGAIFFKPQSGLIVYLVYLATQFYLSIRALEEGISGRDNYYIPKILRAVNTRPYPWYLLRTHKSSFENGST